MTQEPPTYKKPPATSWAETYPKTYVKNELRGKKLTILADSPPTESNKKGIFQLKLLNLTDSVTLFTLVTSKDLNVIIEHPQGFTFDSTEPWAEVIPYEEA